MRVGDCWALYCSQLLHIRNIFLVLDRRLHSDSAQTCRSIEELGVHLFKKHWQLHPLSCKTCFLAALRLFSLSERGS